MKNNTVLKTIPLSQLTPVEHFIGGENLHVVEVYKNDTLYKTRILSTEDVEVISKHSSHADSLLNSSQVLPVMLVKKEFLENITKYGRSSHYHLHRLEGKKPFDQKKSISTNFLVDSKNNDYEFVQLVSHSHSQQIWRNAQGKLYSEPFVLDYLYARISDTYFHLDEFVEKMSRRDDIAFVTYTERFATKPMGILQCPLKGDEDGIGGVINEIEHHLEDGESRPPEKETVTIVYYPKSEDLDKILSWDRDIEVKKPENIKRRLYSVEQFIVEDILGGKEFLQHPIIEETEKPKRKFKH